MSDQYVSKKSFQLESSCQSLRRSRRLCRVGMISCGVVAMGNSVNQYSVFCRENQRRVVGSKAELALRTPRRWRDCEAASNSARLWSAPRQRRFPLALTYASQAKFGPSTLRHRVLRLLWFGMLLPLVSAMGASLTELNPPKAPSST